MQTQDDFNPAPGVTEDMGAAIHRILAPNPSPMTYRGTNTYLLGTRDLAVIDPGPDDTRHLQAILGALKPGQRISHIFVTHAHIDHSPLAIALSRETGAAVHAFGDAQAGRSAVMQTLVKTGLTGGGEGVDHAFAPDILLQDGETISGDDWQLTAHWTPGHFGNHLCFSFGKTVFTGDLVMGWASSLVSPPDGDLTDFMHSCHRLKPLKADIFHSGHGRPIIDPAARLDWLINHRLGREAAIKQQLARGPATAIQLAQVIYTDTPTALMPAATRNVLAHLIDLYGKKETTPLGDFSATSRFALTGAAT